MPNCQQCGAFVTAHFERVYSNPETGQVHGCPACVTVEALHQGAPATPPEPE